MHFVVIPIMLSSSSLWGSSSSLSSICYNTALSDSQASSRLLSTVRDFTVLEHMTTLEADTLGPLALEPPADSETLPPLSDRRGKLLMQPQKKVADGMIGAMMTMSGSTSLSARTLVRGNRKEQGQLTVPILSVFWLV